MSSVARRVFAWTLLLACAPGPAGFAAEPALPECPADRALVHFVDPRPHKGQTPVFVDLDALGYVDGRKYFSAVMEPGTYLIWGNPADPQWFEFRAGRRYVLVVDPEYRGVEPQARDPFGGSMAPAQYSTPGSWRVEDPRRVEELIRSLGLEALTFDEADRAELRKKITRKKHKRAMKQAGTSHTLRIPDTIDDVRYRKKSRSRMVRSLQAIQKTGRLTVESQRIRFEAGKDVIEIPLHEIRSFAGSQDEGKMRLEILHGPQDDPQAAFFVTGTYQEHNRIMMALLEAMSADP